VARSIEYNATLTERIDFTDALALFRFRPDAPLPEAPWFVPGQYCVLGMNNTHHPELGAVQRRMSIASSSWERSHIEFYIRYVRHPASTNPLTHLLWTLQEGDRAAVRAVPKGRFTVADLLGDEDTRLRLFVAAGTGLAPYLSMLRSQMDAAPQATLDHDIVLHGASYPEELGLRDTLESWAPRGLRYLPTVSRPGERPAWQGIGGRVEDFFLPERLVDTEDRLGLAPGTVHPDRVAVFVCGLQGTIGRCIERLALRGFVPDDRRLRAALRVPDDTPSSLFFEQYDTEPVIDLKDTENLDRLRTALEAAR